MRLADSRRCVAHRALVAANALRHRGRPEVTHSAPACGGTRVLIAFHHPQAGIAATLTTIDPLGRIVSEYDTTDVADAVETYLMVGTAGLA